MVTWIDRRGVSSGRWTAKVWFLLPGRIGVLASKSLGTCDASEALLLAARNP